jgi:hypothetical protein
MRLQPPDLGIVLPWTRVRELCPGSRHCAVQSRAIASAALMQLRIECVIGTSPSPPCPRTESFPTLTHPRRLLTQEPRDHGSSVMTITAMQRCFPRTFLNLSHGGLRHPLLSGGPSRIQRRRCAFNAWGQINPAIWILPPGRLLYVRSTTLHQILCSSAKEIATGQAPWGVACPSPSRISTWPLHRFCSLCWCFCTCYAATFY